MKRTTVVMLLCALTVATAYYLISNADRVITEGKARQFAEYLARRPATTGMPPVQLWWEAPPAMKEELRLRKAARLVVRRGKAFLAEEHVPMETISEMLNGKVLRQEIEYVIVFPTRGTKWGELFPILDECRKSRVRIVFLNQYES